MSKYTGFNEFLTKDSFIREPVDNMCRKIDYASRNVILTGGRCIGKTTVLLNKENIGLGSINQCIYTTFNTDLFSLTNKMLEGDFAEHYYELEISSALISYVKRYYPLTYENELKKFDEVIETMFNDINNYVRNCRYKNLEKCATLKQGDLSSKIFNIIKEKLDINKLSLAIDRFDWLKQRSQEIIEPYFDLFDKTIITVDDMESLQNNTLNNKYSIGVCSYNLDVNFIKEFVKRLINEYEDKELFPISIITDDLCEILIKLSGGNLKFIKNIIYRLFLEYKYNPLNQTVDIDKCLYMLSEDENEQVVKVRKMGAKPKLYL